MNLLLPIIYLLIFSYIIYKLSFFNQLFQDKKIILFLLSAKILAGFFYVFYHIQIKHGGDIHLYISDSLVILNELKSNPYNYLQLVLGPNNISVPKHLEKPILEMGFWEDTSAYMVVRFNALFSIFTFSNYYLHGVFSGLFSFIGCYLFSLPLKKYYNFNNIAILSIFLFPPILFWTSGPHKEFVSVVAIGLAFYGLMQILHTKTNYVKYTIISIIGLGLLFAVRSHIAGIFTIITLTYLFNLKIPKFSFVTMAITVLILLVALNFILFWYFQKDLSFLIIEKNKLFNALKTANTSFNIPDFKSIKEITLYTPQALLNATSRPFFWEIKSIEHFIVSIESFFITVLLIVSLLYYNKLVLKEKKIYLYFLFFGISYLIVSGLIVPNWGAIVRYRSIALLFIVPICIQSIFKITFFSRKCT